MSLERPQEPSPAVKARLDRANRITVLLAAIFGIGAFALLFAMRPFPPVFRLGFFVFELLVAAIVIWTVRSALLEDK